MRMKKIMTILALMMLLTSFLIAFKIEPAQADTEQIINGGFESDLTGWTHGGDSGHEPDIYSGVHPHTGSKECWFSDGWRCWVQQAFSPVLAGSTIAQAQVWTWSIFYGGEGAYFQVIVTYSDSSTDSATWMTQSGETETWILRNFLSIIDVAKSVQNIRIWNTAEGVDDYGGSIDDVSLTSSPCLPFIEGFEDNTLDAWTGEQWGEMNVTTTHVYAGTYSANSSWTSHTDMNYRSHDLPCNPTFLNFTAHVYFSAINLPDETVFGISAINFMTIESDGVEFLSFAVARYDSDSGNFRWGHKWADQAWESEADQGSLNPTINTWFTLTLTMSIDGAGEDFYNAYVNGTLTWSGSDYNNYGDSLDAVIIGGCLDNMGATFIPTFEVYFDEIIVDDELPSEVLCRFRSEPSGLFIVQFSAGGSWYWTPQDLNLPTGLQTFTINSGSLKRYVSSTVIYGFDYWMVTNSSGTFNVTGATITPYVNEPTNITLIYSVHLIRVTSSPEVSADFTESGYTFTTPQNIYRGNFSHTFTPESTIAVNATFQYQFAYWQVNSTSYTGTTLTFSSDYPTNVTLFYTLAYIPPVIPFIYNTGALNATYYMRSDTHTIHDELGYKLLTENTQTPAFDEKLSATTQNVSYGIRVWTVTYLGNEYELTSGNPVAVATKTDAGGQMIAVNWNCPAWSSMVDSLKVRVYQRFDSEAWSLRRTFITKTGLYYRLPAATWTIHYYVIRTVGSTNSTFGHGSYTTFNSRIDLQYYKANPWELALAKLIQRNYLGFLFTPWTYWFGDLFWTIILFGAIIMFYLRTGSLKPVLALLWILGGSGSILWALIPATALHIAVIMLALAMTFSILRLISK